MVELSSTSSPKLGKLDHSDACFDLSHAYLYARQPLEYLLFSLRFIHFKPAFSLNNAEARRAIAHVIHFDAFGFGLDIDGFSNFFKGTIQPFVINGKSCDLIEA